MDNHNKSERSFNMSQIHSQNTKPEEKVRKYLFSHGFRYRKNVKTLPGTPDIVLPRFRTVVFVNGCFWHAHEGCKYYVFPKSREEYWRPKFEKNVERDKKNYRQLEELGWHVIVIWECEMKHGKTDEVLHKLANEIVEMGDYEL